jgi:hypothetical protein
MTQSIISLTAIASIMTLSTMTITIFDLIVALNINDTKHY